MGVKRALLVIDVLDNSIDPSGSLYVGQTSRRIIEPIARKIKEFRALGEPVIYVCDAHAFSLKRMAKTFGAQAL